MTHNAKYNHGTKVPAQHFGEEHIHGSDCNHGHQFDEHYQNTRGGHVHGLNCNHGHEDHHQHEYAHGPNCNHGHEENHHHQYEHVHGNHGYAERNHQHEHAHGPNCNHEYPQKEFVPLTINQLKDLSVKELKQLISERGLSSFGCLYKEDLIAKLLEN